MMSTDSPHEARDLSPRLPVIVSAILFVVVLYEVASYSVFSTSTAPHGPIVSGVTLFLSAVLLLHSSKKQRELRTSKWEVENALAAETSRRERTADMMEERTYFFETLVRDSPLGIVMHDRDRTVTLANKAFCDIFGYTNQECLGRRLDDLIVQSGAEGTFSKNIEQIADGTVLHAVVKRRRKDHTLVDVEIHASRLLDENMEYRGAFALFQDVSQRIETAEALRRSEEAFRTLCAASPVGIFRVNAKGQLSYVNGKLLEITGMTLERASSGDWSEAIHRDDRGWVIDTTRKFLREDQEFTVRHRFEKPSGEVVHVEVHGKPLRNDKGRSEGFVGTIEKLDDPFPAAKFVA